MAETTLAILMIVALLGLLALGLWIGLALMGVGFIAMALFTSRPVGDALATTVWSHSALWGLASLPLFIWMGEILFRSRLSEGLFSGLAPLMRRMPGGLIHVNIVGCTVFAAISGSSAATLATIGKITVPELKKRGYPDKMAYGTLAGASTLGLLIPPSIIMIVYGVTAQVSITRLFMAGIFPGIMLAALFIGYILIWGRFTEEGRSMREERASLKEKLQGLLRLAPVAGLIIVVIGSIYSGLASPTEAAVLGVLGALILSAAERTLSQKAFIEGLMGATKTTSMIMLLVAGSAFLTLAMGFTGLPRALAEWIGGMNLSPWMLIAALTLFYVILGFFLDGISSIVLTMAVVEPLVRGAGIDMIWFGIFVVLVAEMAMITPPVGFNLFLVQSMTGRDLGFIARAAFPMFLLMVVGVVLLTAFPGLALWLPEVLTARN
ncbi:TRAP transporter large permease subunit [uncultured Roseovarius sp.]|uniref:TRAP transporter large permease n=1 Tax=uncultured Roseovarius sp. TaxID=293344 RepID=UPI00261F2FFA|nr:TRAP transporter large permease subunit [uncultured Roseovarius sp.]